MDKVRLDFTGALPVLALVFAILKLTDTIDWSWWWVLAPIWMPIAIVGALFIIAIVITVIVTLVKELTK